MIDALKPRVWIAVHPDGKPCHSMPDYCSSKPLFDAARYCAEGTAEWREFVEVAGQQGA